MKSFRDDRSSRCKVCRKENVKTRTEELKVTRVFLIPILKVREFYEICPDCRSRMQVNRNDRLLDSKL